MDINRLRYFTVLSDTSSMREASELLHISQPALSKAMKQLEYELNEQLIVPSGRGIKISDKGQIIAAKAKKILESLDKITKEESTDAQRIRIGSFEVFTTYFMGRVISDKLSDYKIDLRELLPGKLEEQIELGNVDIGITYLPVPNPNLDFIKVTDIEARVVGLKNKFKTTPFEELPFIVPITPVEGLPHKVKGIDGWPENIMPRKIIYRVDLLETALELCRRGHCVAYAPKFIIDLHNKQVKPEYSLGEIKLPKKLKLPKQSIYMVKRKSDIEDDCFKKVASMLRVIK